MSVHEPLPFRGSNVAACDLPLAIEGVSGLSLPLYRLREDGDSAPLGPVLLLHGASAWSHSFTVGAGHGLAGFLLEKGFDVFLLDWRGSKNLVARYGPDAAAYEATSLDSCAEHDVRCALDGIRVARANARRPIAIVAHCVGAGVTAMAIATNRVVAAEDVGKTDRVDRVDRVVLSTLGLFYEVAWDGVLKGEDHLLERVRDAEPKPYAVDSNPKVPFPEAIQTAYDLWPKSALPQDAPERFRKLSFMFGMPYLPSRLVEGLHSEDGLAAQFGQMHLRLFQHGVQNVRRGFVAPLDADESVSDLGPPAVRRRSISRRPVGGRVGTGTPAATDRYLDLTPWKRLTRVHLITGQQNTLWHRTSVDSMHDFLRRELSAEVCTKKVFAGYGHQDLLWGKRSVEDVFPSILEALTDT